MRTHRDSAPSLLEKPLRATACAFQIPKRPLVPAVLTLHASPMEDISSLKSGSRISLELSALIEEDVHYPRTKVFFSLPLKLGELLPPLTVLFARFDLSFLVLHKTIFFLE